MLNWVLSAKCTAAFFDFSDASLAEQAVSSALWWIDRKLLVIVNYMQNRVLNKTRLQICLTPRWKFDLCDRVGQSEEGKNNPKHVTILFQEAWKQTFSKWIWREWDEAGGLNLSCSFVTDLAWSSDLSLDKEKTLAAEFCQSLVLRVRHPPRHCHHHSITHTHTPPYLPTHCRTWCSAVTH